MNLTDFSLKYRTLTVVLTVTTLIAGVISFNRLSRLEDPEFTIKDALVVTSYPGATAFEVEEEISDRLELAAQKLSQVDEVESRNIPGLSTLTVTIKREIPGSALPQVWDELRRKIGDAQKDLPPGAGTSQVIDDFGDVYGVFLALHGDEYSYAELRDFTKVLRRELVLVPDVAKVELFGLQPEVVYIEFDRERIAQLNISKAAIANQLLAENLVSDAGQVTVGNEYLAIEPSSLVHSVEDLGNVLISVQGQPQVRLRDIATIRRDYREPATEKLRFDGHRAIGIGISTTKGGNVVNMGRLIKQRLAQLEAQMPLGMELGTIYMQSDAVTSSIDAFLVNLIEAVVIVVVVLLFFMGMRSGLIIGFVLLLTIAGTFILMGPAGVALERISLGALIIALGMLVDNAIVIIDGMLVRIANREDPVEAAKVVSKQASMPLLGATVVAILAFAAIGTSPDSTGEFCRSLFTVILISLGLSWVTAITITPLLGIWFLKPPAANQIQKDPYDTKFYRVYTRFLAGAIRKRWHTVCAVLFAFGLAVIGFGMLQQSFFPASTSPKFRVDLYLPLGTKIDETETRAKAVESYIAKLEGISHVATSVGKGPLRFILTFTPEKTNSGYAQFLVDVDDYKRVPEFIEKISAHLKETSADAVFLARPFDLGPSPLGKIEARIIGPDPDVLRTLEQKVTAIFEADKVARGTRSDWYQRVKVLEPVLSEDQANAQGITSQMVADAIREGYSGLPVGVYRERDDILPIIFRAPEAERNNISSLRQIPIWSPAAQHHITLGSVITDFETQWRDDIVIRLNRKRTLTVVTDPAEGTASALLARLQPQVEALDFPAGYTLEWGGEYESSRDSQEALVKPLPLFFTLMVLIVIALFDSIRQPLIIWLCVPLALIGVSGGLLLTNQPFGFMALLGFLSLAGMLIKNAIVLIDQINLEIAEGKTTYNAILSSGVSRLRPVAMAAATTILGMLPLLQDAFYVAMAVTICAGLLVATVLTMFFVPVLYAIFFKAEVPVLPTAGLRPHESAHID